VAGEDPLKRGLLKISRHVRSLGRKKSLIKMEIVERSGAYCSGLIHA
jgi:hypothetical protein